MFKIKSKKGSLEVLKETLIFGSGLLAGKMSEGVKQANHRIIHINEYMKKDPNIALVKDRIQKHPLSSVFAIVGIGVTIFSLFSLTQKK